jgi:hypothetical protein
MVKGEIFLPPDDEDEAPEVTRGQVTRERQAAAARARAAERETKTRRSWYTSAEAADTFQRTVDDIHHATRVPKHLVVAELLSAAVGQAARVQRRLTPKGEGGESHASDE